ncbi:hypothetical protein RAM19_07380 [Bartonella apihabitans]|uniref:hypothetical protein n=1 Tax=uncultured Bartonella sp. TaxID=104108 RepID=UPI0025ED8249|nr:hypothetical protein [Bartonella apihabitans]WLT07936.1 hypothetical protein RAM19_07380 [Bartonella apihabitans]
MNLKQTWKRGDAKVRSGKMHFKSSWRIESKQNAVENLFLKMRRQAFRGGVTGNGFEFISNYKKALSPKFFRESCRGGNRDERAQNGTDFKVKRGEY